MSEQHVVLKPGKEKAILNRHHWIFSGAIQRYPKQFENGSMYSVVAADGKMLGTAYFNRNCSIAGRMVSFDATPPLEAISKHIRNAVAMRKQLVKTQKTNACRLINGEGDLLPGLIVDQYDEVLVMQVTTLGMNQIKEWLIEQLVSLLHPKGIFEKSILPAREMEGLKPFQGMVYGEKVEEVEIKENGLKFIVSLTEGQKTGFFMDHREMREQVRQLSKEKRVLNCFAYTGAFSVYALSGGASHVTSVELSTQALEMAKRNAALNGFESTSSYEASDVFQYLRENDLSYDLIILDPPAFAKRKEDVVAACRGYKEINRVAMQKMPANSLLLTCSCSYHVDRTLFQQVIFQAAVEAGRTVRIIGTHHMAADHPVNICHPETDYLKSLLLFVSLPASS